MGINIDDDASSRTDSPSRRALFAADCRTLARRALGIIGLAIGLSVFADGAVAQSTPITLNPATFPQHSEQGDNFGTDEYNVYYTQGVARALTMPEYGGGGVNTPIAKDIIYYVACQDPTGTVDICPSYTNIVTELGLNFDEDTRTIRGAPTAAGTFVVGYIMIDAANRFSGSTAPSVYSLTAFTFTVFPPMTYLADPANVFSFTSDVAATVFSFTRGVAAGEVTLPANYPLGGTGYKSVEFEGAKKAPPTEIPLTALPSWLTKVRTEQLATPAAYANYYEIGSGDPGACTPGGACVDVYSGTPDQAGRFIFRTDATDRNNAAFAVEFTFLISPPPTFIVSPAPLIFPASATQIVEILPPAEQELDPGVTELLIENPGFSYELPLLYSISGSTFVTIDSSTRALTFSASESSPAPGGVTELTYTATDPHGASASTVLTMDIQTGLAFNPSPPREFSFTAGKQGVYTLPPLTDGTPFAGSVYSYLLSGALQTDNNFSNVVFNAREFRITPRDGAIGAHLLTYLAWDADNTTLSAEVTVRVFAGVDVSRGDLPRALTYTVGAPITPLNFPSASGGSSPLTYTLAAGLADEPIVAGLMFDPIARRLSGTPSDAHDDTFYVYRAADHVDEDYFSTEIAVVAAQTFTAAAPNARTYSADLPIAALTLPDAVGGYGEISYRTTLSRDGFAEPAQAPAGGLNFDLDTRELSGTPRLRGDYILTFTSVDANRAMVSLLFSFTVKPATRFLSRAQDLSFTVGADIGVVRLPAIQGGTPPLVYSLDKTPPNGIVFDAVNRQLTGAPTQVAAAVEYILSVIDSVGVAGTDQHFAIQVFAAPALPTLADHTFTVNHPAAPLTLPSITTGTAPIAYALGGAPIGMVYELLSRVLSGTPNTIGDNMLTYAATDANGVTDRALFAVTVVDAPSFTDAAHFYTFTMGAPAAHTLPQSDGFAVMSYATSPLPDGLTYDADTHSVGGTAARAGEFGATLTGFDANGATADTTLSFLVNVTVQISAPPGAPFRYSVGGGVDLSLPGASGGTLPYTYAISGLPDGLIEVVEGESGHVTSLAGSPSADAIIAGQNPTPYNLTYSVTEANGATDQVVFAMLIYNGPFFTGEPPRIPNYPVDREIPPLTLPGADGDGRPITYTLEPLLDEYGLTFVFDDAMTFGVISGTPTDDAVGVHTLTYTAAYADNSGESVQIVFTIRITRGEHFRELNRALLPKITDAIIGGVNRAIDKRIDLAFTEYALDSSRAQANPRNRATASIGGQRTMAGWLGAHGNALADGTLEWRDWLGDADIALPLSAGATAAHWRRNTNVWFSGAYRRISDEHFREPWRWDGDVRALYLGADAVVEKNLLAGLALSRARADFDYLHAEFGRGDYKVDLDGWHPYVSGRRDAMSWWASASISDGEITIRENARTLKSDVAQQAWSAGVRAIVWRDNINVVTIKGETTANQIDISGSADIPKDNLDVSRTRALIELRKRIPLTAGVLEPQVELGLRNDSGDRGGAGLGGEIVGGLRWSNPQQRLYLATRAYRVVRHSGDYDEWGVYGNLRRDADANGRGLSANIKPHYGASDDAIESARIWADDLHENKPLDITTDEEYSLQVNLRVGYGFAAPGRRLPGTWTPFAEFQDDRDINSYRFGVNWALDDRTQLDVYGERRITDARDEHLLWAKGNVKF